MSSPARILLIEDDPSVAENLRRVLTDDGQEVLVERRGDEGLAAVARGTFNAVVTDLRLPGLNGLELVERLHRAQPRLPIILITAFGTTETAISAMKFGAFDYLQKPFPIPQLLDLVRKAIESNRLMSEPVVLGDGTAARDAIIGQSPAMQHIYKEVGRVATKPVNVLIRGATGTGKELIARALYQYGDRANAPFIAVNCAAIPETLLESELFGHERGAFTGAESRRIGRFEQADGGTLFLDEIGDMSPSTQVKLVRVLQEGTLQRLGGKETISVDVRVVAATHRDLEEAIRQKLFREDLFYRLSVVVIALPLLRDRREDIPDLVRYFLRKHGPDLGNANPSVSQEAIDALRAQAWPGNVRELENTVRKVLLLAQNYTISADHVRTALARAAPSPSAAIESLGGYLDDLLAAAQRGEVADAHARLLDSVERELFARAIRQAQGNQSKAARWLGVSRVTMKAKLVEYGLHPGENPAPPAD
jgi:nitrogen regulation protein NR(I)